MKYKNIATVETRGLRKLDVKHNFSCHFITIVRKTSKFITIYYYLLITSTCKNQSDFMYLPC